VKGFKDGVNAFDVELARLSNDGLIFAARGGQFLSDYTARYPL
jgi:hypothetical protein